MRVFTKDGKREGDGHATSFRARPPACKTKNGPDADERLATTRPPAQRGAQPHRMSSAPSLPPNPSGESWRNFAWLVGGRTFRLALSVVVGAWVARQLGPADYGRLNTALAVVMMLLAVAGLGLDSFVRQQLVRQPASAGEILGTCIGLRLAAGAVGFVALALAVFCSGATHRGVWLVLGAMLLTHTPLSIDFWFQARLLMRHSAVAQNLAFAFSSILRVGLILLGAPLISFAAVIVLEGPVAAFYLLRVYRCEMPAERFAWRTEFARGWLHACWPLLAASIVTAALARLDQTLVLWLAGPIEAGRFAAASRVFELGVFVPTALVTSLMPSIAGSAADPVAARRTARHALNTVAATGWLLAITLLVGAGWIVPGLFGAAYLGSETTLRLLAVALLFHGIGSVRTECWVSAGWTGRLLAATLLGAVLNAALALWWIPRWGGSGAAAATLIALAVTHVVLSFWWRDARQFARWQLAALAGAALWQKKAAAPA